MRLRRHPRSPPFPYTTLFRSAMRRQGLVPLRAALLLHQGGASTARLLDLGCGTGEFLREVKRNYPRLSVTGIDLSAPYLRSEEHTSELQSPMYLVCRLLLEKK